MSAPRLFAVLAVVSALFLPAEAASPITALKLKAIGRGTTQVPLSKNTATVVVFVSMDCPMSMDYGQRIGSMEQQYAARGVQVILINSNRNESDAQVEKVRKELNIPTRIYRDISATVAEQLGVVATPTAVVLDAAGAIRYKGNIDDSRDPARIRTRFVEDALDAVLTGRPLQVAQTRVLGCSIKR